MKKFGNLILLIIAIAVLIAMNYKSFDGFVVKNFSNEQFVHVSRVIDWDTVVDTNNIH